MAKTQLRGTGPLFLICSNAEFVMGILFTGSNARVRPALELLLGIQDTKFSNSKNSRGKKFIA